jgi:hypothetical protein
MIDRIRETVATVLEWRTAMTELPAALVRKHLDVTQLDMLTDADTENDVLDAIEKAIDKAEIAALGEPKDG